MSVDLARLASTYQGALIRVPLPPATPTMILPADPRRWSVWFAPTAGLGASLYVAPLRITAGLGMASGWPLAPTGLTVKFPDAPGIIGAEWWGVNTGAAPIDVEMWVSTYVG